MDNLSVILVDDHKLFREGLKLLLKNISMVKEVDEGLVSKKLKRLNPGDQLEVDGPFGFFTINEENKNTIKPSIKAREVNSIGLAV